MVHNGVVYHVQTEDKGLETPLILSLVYSGGAILASKRTPYDDLIARGFDERILSERVQRQHKLLCAAVYAGRIEDLKQMTRREAEARQSAANSRPAPAAEPVSSAIASDGTPAGREARPPEAPAPFETKAPKARPVASVPPETTSPVAVPVKPPPAAPAPPRAATSQPQSPKPAPNTEVAGALQLSLLDEQELRGGETANLRILLSRNSPAGARGIAGAAVTVKILGSAFRPTTTTATTNVEGIAVLAVSPPVFSTGRAAMLIHAVSGDDQAELRRVIRPA